MVSEILVYLRLGFEHITDPGGYDHLLFVAALTASDLGDLRRLFWLVTAFTVGHSITLALATLGLVRIDTQLVEFLIPLTILATSLVNIAGSSEGSDPAGPSGPESARASNRPGAKDRIRYGIAVGFGLIHGLGFSAFLRAALGGEASILLPLLSFNIGLEIGQLAIVAVLSLIAALLVSVIGLPKRAWVLGVSSITGLLALAIFVDRLQIST
ncbi:MAG: HupE/UreJ family protein [marine benthic group bacterium]|jgi:hypothetical protein|nr:HupE/UreJ family protein [Candidatus Carthagonibacter metallireducens]MCL7982644.1 HupE/UreJ family protein [Gemmatimonadota bacterium]MCL7986156.1 HupE/UreJ family protein [Gemmatimonadota bacterium]